MEDVRKEVSQVSHQKEEAQSKLTSLQSELDTLNEQRKEIKVSMPSAKSLSDCISSLIMFASFHSTLYKCK